MHDPDHGTADAEQALLACAVQAARAAGAHALRNLHRRREVHLYADHDIKLVLDRECQEVARGVILGLFPGHAVLGEEDDVFAAAPGAGTCEWVIDPIDGTVNFFHSLPQWCCSVAVRRGDRTLAGAVFAPELEELYTAAASAPSALNGAPIRVSATPALDQAIVMTGADRSLAPELPSFTFLTRIAEHAQRARVMGSAALDLCRVASGQADGYFEGGIYLWDVAAAGLIVQQAGGRAEILKRHREPHRLRYLASNGLIHDELKALVSL